MNQTLVLSFLTLHLFTQPIFWKSYLLAFDLFRQKT